MCPLQNVFSSTDMPTCLLCVCISGSVYCDDAELEQIPPLPKRTTHFYARFNKIQRVHNRDFINLSNATCTEITNINFAQHKTHNEEIGEGQQAMTWLESCINNWIPEILQKK